MSRKKYTEFENRQNKDRTKTVKGLKKLDKIFGENMQQGLLKYCER